VGKNSLNVSISEQKAGATGVLFLLLFSLSVFVSKAAVNLTSALLLLWMLYYLTAYNKKRVVLKYRYAWIFLLPFAAGFFLSFFSPLGLEGAGRFLDEYRFWLLVLPFVVFVSRPEDVEKIFLSLNLSAFGALVYGVVSVWPDIWLSKFPTLMTIGRHSDLMFSLALANIVVLVTYQFNLFERQVWIKTLLLINTVFVVYSLIVSKMSAAWVGFLVGALFFSVFYYRKFFIVLIATAVGLALFVPDTIKKEAVSIFEYENSRSNTIRIQLYRTGLDFVLEEKLFFAGTGIENSKDRYLEFMDRKSENYQKNNPASLTHPGNFHNSFLQMAVDCGMLFLMVYVFSVVYLCTWMMKLIKNAGSNDRSLIIAALTVTLGFWVSQLFHGGLHHYASLSFHLLFFSGCFAANRYEKPLKRMEAGHQ